MKRYYALLFGAFLVLSGCLHGEAGREEVRLEGEPWILVRLMEKNGPFATVGEEPFLEFGVEAGRFTGFGGCNRFSGGYSTDGDGGLSLGPVAATRRFCQNIDAEQAFFQALERTVAYRITDDDLLLLGSDGRELLRFLRN